MSLILTILNKPNPGQEISSAFQTEGSIGRSADNSWVLVDPERSTSSKHALIFSKNGSFYITDTSTNGVFVNDSDIPIGKGSSLKLNHGDRLNIGDYDISVTIQADTALPLGDPDSSPFNPSNDAFPTSNAPARAENLGQIANPSSLGIGDNNSLDPLALLNGSGAVETMNSARGIDTPDFNTPGFDNRNNLDLGSHQSIIPNDPFAPLSNQQLAAGTSGDNSSPLQQQFEPRPTASKPAGGGMIPDDWNIGAGKANSQPPKQAALGSNSPTLNMDPEAPLTDAGNMPTVDDLLSIPGLDANITNTPSELIPGLSAFDPEPQPTSQITSTHTNAPPMAPTPTTAPTYNESDSTAVIGNLLKGMGLQHLKLSQEEQNFLALEAGNFLRTTVNGLVGVLRARAAIKSEFRMSMTIIQAKENNPLKFSPSGFDALSHMFSPTNSSYMAPVESVNESFNDLEAHMIAVMAGMQAALNKVLSRFDPDMLVREFESREKAKGFTFSSKKAQYWDIYTSHYRQIISSVEDDFHEIFGDEFTNAYQNQVNKLKTTRKP